MSRPFIAASAFAELRLCRSHVGEACTRLPFHYAALFFGHDTRFSVLDQGEGSFDAGAGPLFNALRATL